MHSGSPLCRDSLSRNRDLSSYRCSSGAPRFCRSAKAEISTKRPLLRQPRIPCWKWLSISGKCPLLSRPLGFQLLLKKLAVSSRVCLCVTNTMCSLIDRHASENTDIFVVRIQRQHSLPVSNRIGQTPRSDAKWCLRVLDDFHLFHEVLFEPPFCVAAIYVFGLATVLFWFFHPSLRFRQSFEPGAS